MSSRNMLLTPEHRKAAPHIYRTLIKAVEIFSQSDRYSPQELSDLVRSEINSETLLRCEYVEIINSLTLRPLTEWADAKNIRIYVAVYAGEIRLIDNIKLK